MLIFVLFKNNAYVITYRYILTNWSHIEQKLVLCFFFSHNVLDAFCHVIKSWFEDI